MIPCASAQGKKLGADKEHVVHGMRDGDVMRFCGLNGTGNRGLVYLVIWYLLHEPVHNELLLFAV